MPELPTDSSPLTVEEIETTLRRLLRAWADDADSDGAFANVLAYTHEVARRHTATTVAHMKQGAEQAQEEIQELRRKLYVFQREVRDAAITVWQERGDWCLDGLNETLTKLGLDEYAPRSEVRAVIEVRFTNVEGAVDDAISLVRSNTGLRVSYLDNYDDYSEGTVVAIREINGYPEDDR